MNEQDTNRCRQILQFGRLGKTLVSQAIESKRI